MRDGVAGVLSIYASISVYPSNIVCGKSFIFQVISLTETPKRKRVRVSVSMRVYLRRL